MKILNHPLFVDRGLIMVGSAGLRQFFSFSKTTNMRKCGTRRKGITRCSVVNRVVLSKVRMSLGTECERHPTNRSNRPCGMNIMCEFSMRREGILVLVLTSNI